MDYSCRNSSGLSPDSLAQSRFHSPITKSLAKVQQKIYSTNSYLLFSFCTTHSLVQETNQFPERCVANTPVGDGLGKELFYVWVFLWMLYPCEGERSLEGVAVVFIVLEEGEGFEVGTAL